MALVDKLYDWLTQGPAPECDRTLAAGLAHAEQPYSNRIVRTLLKRAFQDSWTGLIQHYDRLSPEARAELHARGDLMRAGVASAAKSGSVAARCNALAAFGDGLDPRLAYLLPNALRDDSRDVRAAAAHVLRETAAAFLDRTCPGAADGEDASTAAERQLQHEELVAALRDALRTFDLHFRVEVVEAALWYATYLGDTLWETLARLRSRCGYVVSEHLESWNHPRLAGFLLLALTQREWRAKTSPLLREWATPEQVTALLRCSNLLDDPQVRQALSVTKLPWIEQLDAQMSGVPADLHARVPRWVCCLGYNDDARARLLSKWASSDSLPVHRAAVYALATLDSELAAQALESVAAGDLPLTPFVRWWLAGRQYAATSSGSSAAAVERGGDARGTAAVAAPHGSDAAELARLWQTCRRNMPLIDVAALDTVRENLEGWRTQLRAYARSSDARDRLLVLWLLGTDSRAHRFRAELQELADDSVGAISRAARALLVLSPPPAALDETGPRPGEAELATARRTVLERLREALGDGTLSLSASASPVGGTWQDPARPVEGER